MQNVSFLFKIIIITTIIYLYSCRSDRSKAEHSSTTQVCDGTLYIETYTIFGGGAGGGDRVSDYLTDSVNFRMYIGTNIQGIKTFTYKCQGDSVCVEEIQSDEVGIPYNTKIISTIVSTKYFDLTFLRKQKVFE